MSHYLSIDYGTQSVRAMVFDRNGELLAKARIVENPAVSEEPGWAEQDPEIFWHNLAQACQKLFAAQPKFRSTIKSVTLTTQRGTLINVDRYGNPLRPAMIWMDQREADVKSKPNLLWRQLFHLVGVQETIKNFQKQAEANWIREFQPEIWSRTHKFLLLSGYLSFKLVGSMVDSVGSQVGYIPFDYKKHRWANNLSWKWKAVAIPRDKLPALISQGSPLGEISKEAAAATGIPEGIPLIAAAADKACEVIGSGCLDYNVGCLSYGTAASINVTSNRYVECIPFVPPYPSAIPGFYNVENQVEKGYWLVSWFKKEFAHREEKEAKAKGLMTEDLLEDQIRQIAPGSDGLLVQPYWSPGIRYPGPEARGAMIGFHGGHTKAHVYRAILEGIAFALREGRNKIEKRMGTRLRRLRCSGGGSQSDTVMQITADIFNLPVERPHTYETSGLGAAICGAVGVGDFDSYRSAINAMTHSNETFLPQSSHVKTYEHLYGKVYEKLYPSLKPLYHELM